MAARSEFAIPVKGTVVPSGPDWLHEIKHDGYRMKVLRDHDRVRLITKGGFDWTKRYPWIVDGALKIRTTQFVLDGEAVVLNVDGSPISTPCIPASTTTRSNSTLSTSCPVTVTTTGACRSRCGRQTWRGLLARPDRRDLPRPVRARRNRPRSIPSRLHHGPRRHGLEARGLRLFPGPLQSLDQEQEPETSRL
ncbi:ATP-dependent DNA ligase [Bradyrhizobium yuanmingense]|uniref:ATP-dependent DNA ligase n=1 Tax=Bradyrhizobium yuanmingense TaxID=108015 RepID=UPI003512F602